MPGNMFQREREWREREGIQLDWGEEIEQYLSIFTERERQLVLYWLEAATGKEFFLEEAGKGTQNTAYKARKKVMGDFEKGLKGTPMVLVRAMQLITPRLEKGEEGEGLRFSGKSWGKGNGRNAKWTAGARVEVTGRAAVLQAGEGEVRQVLSPPPSRSTSRSPSSDPLDFAMPVESEALYAEYIARAEQEIANGTMPEEVGRNVIKSHERNRDNWRKKQSEKGHGGRPKLVTNEEHYNTTKKQVEMLVRGGDWTAEQGEEQMKMLREKYGIREEDGLQAGQIGGTDWEFQESE